MKEIVILIVVLLLIFVPNILIKNYLNHSGNEMKEMIEQMKENIIKQSSVDPLEATMLKNVFLDREKKWILLVDHDMLDEIEYEVEDCVAYYTKEHEEEFLTAANRLCDKIEDLGKREEISLGNIL